MSDLAWTNDKRKLSDLVPWLQNPRQIRKEDAERLAESLEDFGQVQTIAIDPDGEIVDGHQRQSVWAALEKYGPDFEVDVRVSSRKLTEQERQKLAVYLHEGAVGEWDYDALSGWGMDIEELVDWGFSESNLLEGFGSQEDDWQYTRKIETPEYTPSDKKPFPEGLYDDSKTLELIKEIDREEGITEDERKFLRIAAQRHTALNFKLIADYYAHSGPEMQRLMEGSALVIIDFEKAISLGFIKLTKKMAALVKEEYG